jgi:hypothetical protein
VYAVDSRLFVLLLIVFRHALVHIPRGLGPCNVGVLGCDFGEQLRLLLGLLMRVPDGISVRVKIIHQLANGPRLIMHSTGPAHFEIVMVSHLLLSLGHLFLVGFEPPGLLP